MKPSKKKRKKLPDKYQDRDPGLFPFYFLSAFTILFIPLLHVQKALDQALMPRTMAMSLFILTMTAFLFAYKNRGQYDFSILRQKIFPVLIAYLAVVIISILFATNYKESFFDIIRTFILAATAGIAATIFVHTEKWKEKIPVFVIIAALIAVSIGMAQYYNNVINATSKTLSDGRPVIYMVFGLMFQKNEYSTALALMLPFVGYAIYAYKKHMRVISAITAFLLLAMIVLVQTRAVWVGLALAVVLTSIVVILYARKLNFPILLRNILIGLMLASTIGIGIIFSMERPKDDFSLLGRIRSITDTRSQHNIHRLNIWRSTITLIKDNPLTGIGAGNWRLNAAYYFDGSFDQVPQLNWARPHNDFLWVFSEKGIIGFLLYLGIFGFGFYYLFYILHHSRDQKDRIMALLLFGGFITYLGTSFFGFPYERINHQVYLALMIGAAAAMYHKIKPSKNFHPKPIHVLAPLIALSVFGAYFGYRTTKQETYLNKALGASHKEDWRAYLHFARLADNPLKSLDPLSNPPEYYEGMALAKLNRHHEAVIAYEKAFKQFPNNMWILNWMGQSYYHTGQYEKAVECLEKVIRIIPAHSEAYINLSATYYRMGDYRQSLEALKRMKDYEKQPGVVSNMRVLENLIRQEKEKMSEKP